ncbi:MAG: hypothetical protein EOO67_17635 [Microbacterium sp.]|nr:MAG: hypothetical protein EOO67_17635 [Microbacterium sp.]
MTSEPLDLREVFDRPWTGQARVVRPWWLRWVPFVPTGFDFRTEVVPTEDGAIVHDTQTFPDGRVWERTMHGRITGPGRWQMTADDMPGGAEIVVGPDGYAFAYTIWAPVLGPLRLPLRCTDEVRFDSADSLTDTIVFRFLGLHVGTLTMRLRRTAD